MRNSHLSAASRHLSLSGKITYLTGAVLSFSGAQVLRFSMSEGAGDGMLLGGAFSASCALTLYDPASLFTFPHSPMGAQVHLYLDGDEPRPLCVFTVGSVSREEGSSRLLLSGSDALGTAFEAAFQDGFSYPISLGEMARGIAAQAGFVFEDHIPGDEIMIAASPAWGEISLRRALAFVAQASGCFASVSREGKLMFSPAWPKETAYEILPEATLKREYGEAVFGPLEGLSIALHKAPRGSQPLSVSSDAALGSQNCLSISGNPLFGYGAPHAEPLARHLFSALQGMKLTQAKVTWRGDPALQLGHRVKITDHTGDTQETLVTSQSLIFSQGFSMQSDCRFSGNQSSVGRLFTSSGALNAAMLSGELDGSLIRAGSIAAQSILSGSITALQLAADAVTAEKIAAASVTADKLAADSVRAKNLSADALEAVDAHLQNAQIDWADIDELTAVIAHIASGKIQNADIDFAHIKDLVAGTAIITQGVGGELYISRLAVTEANMVSLSVGQLLVKGVDGGFYALTVDASGKVTTEKKQVGNDDIGNLSINAGEKLIEGSVTAATLNVQDIFADSAIIRHLMAAHLDVDTLFAREATIDAINALDIRGNQYLKLSVDALRQEIEASASDATGQQMTISFSQGNAIEEERKSITASVHVWKNGEEITDQIPSPAFSWMMEGGSGGVWYGVKEVTLSREDIGKSCQLRCILDEAGSFGAFEIVDGELILTRPDTGVTDAFSLSDGNLYGEEHYSLEDGMLTRNAASNKMQVTTSVFDHSILETSHILIKDKAIDIRSGGNIRIAAGGTLDMQGGDVHIRAGSTLDVASGGKANIDAQDGHVNLGEDFSVSDQGSLVAKTGSFANGLFVRGKEVGTGPDIVVSTTEPSQTGIIWLKPSSVRAVSYGMDTGGARNTLWYDGATASQSRTFALTADSQDVMANGTFLYTLRLPLYEIKEKRTNVKITITAQKAGGAEAVVFPEYTLAEIKQWQEVIVEATVESNVNLGADTGAINVTIAMDGVKSNGGLYLQKADRISLSMVNRTAADSVMPCEIYYKP